MNCLLHPLRNASGACEYCSQPHCAECLQTLLGRQYCPGCYARVAGIAQGKNGRAPGLNGVPPPPGAFVPGGAAPRAPGAAMPGWLSVVLYLVGFLVLEFLSGAALALLLFAAQAIAAPARPLESPLGFDPMNPGALGLPGWSAVFGFVGWASLLMVLVYTGLLSHLIERRRLPELGLRWSRTVFRDAVIGLALALVLFVSTVGVGAALGWYRLTLAATWPQALAIIGVGFLILLPFAAIEEVSIRGYLLHAGARSWGNRGALLFSSLAFAALHSQNPHVGDYPLALLGLALAGLYLGLVVRVTGNLWMAIFLHTGWNLMEGPVFGLPVSGMQLPASVFQTDVQGAAFWTGGAFGPEAGMFLCLLLAIHLAALWCLRPLLRTGSPETSGEAANPTAESRPHRAIPLS